MAKKQRISRYYNASVLLLKALSDLEDDFKWNYEQGDIQQKALANVGGLQCDLFASYVQLLGPDEGGPIVSRSIILRSILENQGTIIHIKNNDKRCEAYLSYVEKMELHLKNRINNIKTDVKDTKWSSSDISQRVSLIDKGATRLCDTLSDFTHGNNIQYFLHDKTLTDAYIKAIDSYSVGVFIGFMAELGIGLEMEDAKRELVFDAINEVKKMKINVL